MAAVKMRPFLRNVFFTKNFNYNLKRNNTTIVKNVTEKALKEAKPFEEMPGVRTMWQIFRETLKFLPIFGNKNEPLRLFEYHKNAVKVYGKTYQMKTLGGRRFVMITDPKDIQNVFQQEGQQPRRRFLDALKIYRSSKREQYASAGILVENGDVWYNTRMKVQSMMLRPNNIEKYISKMSLVSDDFVKKINNMKDERGEVPQFLNELYKWALESIGLITFNCRLGCLEDNLSSESEAQKMLNTINEGFQDISDMEFGPQLWSICPSLSKTYRNIVKSQEYFYSVVLKYINLTKERMKKNNNDEKEFGILENLLKSDLDEREIIVLMIDFLHAGVDTTSHTVGTLLYLLSRNPDKQEKLRTEICQILSKTSDITSRKSLHQFSYLQGCIKEAMRLMPVVDGTSRYFEHDVIIDGYRIPAGTFIALLAQLAGHQGENFEDPDSFKPERWLPGENKPNPFAFLPFGFGVRSCIGQRIALQEMELLMIKLIQNFKIEYHFDDIRMKTRFVNMPDKPLRFNFINCN